MRKSLRNAVLASLCAATAISTLPPEALAGPLSLAPPSVVALDNTTVAIHYRRGGRHPYGHWRAHRWGYHRHRRYGYYRPYYRRVYYRYGYDPAGAIFASAALGLMGAGIAAATAPRWGWGWGPGWGWGGWGPGWGYGGW